MSNSRIFREEIDRIILQYLLKCSGKKYYQWIFKLTRSADVSQATEAAEVKCRQDLSSVQYQIEILDRLDVPPPGAAVRSLAGVRAR